jgi:pilus assembly protein CpaC
MRSILHAVLIGCALVCALQFEAQAQLAGQGTERNNTLQVYIREPGQGPVSESVILPLGQAAIIHLPVDAAEVMVASDEIASAIVRSPRRALLLGQEVGRTNVFFFNSNGTLILDLAVRVERDVAALNDALTRFVPSGRVSAESMNANIILSGHVPSAAAADQALQVARRWVDNPEQVVSFLTIAGRDQVMLRVRIVEMERTIVRQLGVNLSGTRGLGNIEDGAYQSSVGFGTNNSFGIAGQALGGFSGAANTQNLVSGVVESSLTASINALERVGLVRTLAEPNITAISGESAQFLAGGEFPVPVGRDDDGALAIEFKPFGVGLGFTPVVLSEGRIALRVSTEVSDLSTEGATTIGATTIVNSDGSVSTIGGTTIPGLTVNRAETSVEMPSGGSLVIAGLIKEETRQALDGVPGVERLPVLGSLFRSRDFANNETELVVIITPYLVEPTDPDALREPGRGLAAASVATGLFLGRINSVYGSPGANLDGRSWQGPVGFVVD